jgi:hypothetical protein
MALVEFAPGAGEVGRSVFQKLRELRHLHEVSWGSQAPEFYRMDRKERSIALNDQKANAVADLACVLSGAGAGNRMWILEGGQPTRKDRDVLNPRPEQARWLAPVTVHWGAEGDMKFALEWSENVTHNLGLPLKHGWTRKWKEPKEGEETTMESGEVKGFMAEAGAPA